MQIEVVPYDDSWSESFDMEADRIGEALRPVVVSIHHIGSTSVPGMFAKPIIDILIEVRSLARLDAGRSGMKTLGYEVLGEFGISGRRYFRKANSAGVRTHQVHVFESGSVESRRHLAFRDYLVAHSAVASQYSELKQRLATAFPDDIDAYMNGKDSFIKTHEAKALAWWKL
jgi:GrpB-like predicted nucleotidyltransferase (UPF0157 family)